MPNILHGLPVSHLSLQTNYAPTLSHDEANDLYFERRDQNDSHERAIQHIEKNGAPSNWVAPEESDYQGLPDFQHPTSPRPPSPSYASRSNAAANYPAIAVARRNSALAESSATRPTHVGTPNVPLPIGVYRTVKKAQGNNTKDRIVYSVQKKDSRPRKNAAFTVGKNYTESQARAAAIAEREAMESNSWVPRSQR